MPCKFIKSKSITPILFAFSLLLPIASNAANSCSEVLTEKSDQVSQLEKEGDRFNLNHSYIAPTFNRIPPGKFVMFTHDFRGNSFPGQSIDVTLTESFHLMTTPVTQLMWAKLLVLMGNVRPDSINPSIFKNGEDSVKFRNFEDSGISMTMQPNHPVENLRAIDIELFITRLNELSRLAVPQVQKALREIIPDHKLNDVYDLPTEAQMSYVLSNLGQAPHDYFDNNGDMEKYAWMVTNSGNHTHNVATRTPRVIAGRE